MVSITSVSINQTLSTPTSKTAISDSTDDATSATAATSSDTTRLPPEVRRQRPVGEIRAAARNPTR